MVLVVVVDMEVMEEKVILMMRGDNAFTQVEEAEDMEQTEETEHQEVAGLTEEEVAAAVGDAPEKMDIAVLALLAAAEVVAV